MKKILFILTFLIMPCLVFSADNFIDKFSYENGGRHVKLEYTFMNRDAIAVSYFDIKVHNTIDLEDIELEEGLTESDITPKGVKILAGSKLPSGRSTPLKLTVKLNNLKAKNIFQMKNPEPVFTATVVYINGGKKTLSVYPPFIANMKIR